MTASPVELPQLTNDEEGFGWHALNYRTAASVHAQEMFEVLEIFVRQFGQQCYEAGVRAKTLRLEVIRAYLAGMEELAELGPTSLDWHAQKLFAELLESLPIRKGE